MDSPKGAKGFEDLAADYVIPVDERGVPTSLRRNPVLGRIASYLAQKDDLDFRQHMVLRLFDEKARNIIESEASLVKKLQAFDEVGARLSAEGSVAAHDLATNDEKLLQNVGGKVAEAARKIMTESRFFPDQSPRMVRLVSTQNTCRTLDGDELGRVERTCFSSRDKR